MTRSGNDEMQQAALDGDPSSGHLRATTDALKALWEKNGSDVAAAVARAVFAPAIELLRSREAADANKVRSAFI